MHLETGYVAARLLLHEAADLTNIASETDRLLPGGWRTRLDSVHSSYPQTAIEIVTLRPGQLPSIESKPKNKILVRLDSSTLRSSRLAFVTYTLLERDRQLAGMTTIHGSAAVASGGAGILLLGDKGSGKTDTLLALMKQGCLPAGDDLVVLRLAERHKVKLRPGKRTAVIRDRRLRKGRTFYESKRQVELGNPYFLDHEVPVAMVVRINVHPNCTSARVERLPDDRTSEMLRLHENIGRYISGLPTPLKMTKEAAFCRVLHLDVDETASFRSMLVSSLLGLAFYYIQAKTAKEAATIILSLAGKHVGNNSE